MLLEKTIVMITSDGKKIEDMTAKDWQSDIDTLTRLNANLDKDTKNIKFHLWLGRFGLVACFIVFVCCAHENHAVIAILDVILFLFLFFIELPAVHTMIGVRQFARDALVFAKSELDKMKEVK